MSMELEALDKQDIKKEPEVDPLFAKRMEISCDNHPRIPDMKHGRLTWIRNELKLHGMKVALQTVQRWYHGRARPRNQKMIVLAKALGVDHVWLASGKIPEIDAAGAKRLKVALEGGQNCVMGFIQMAGWQCAYPEDDDPFAKFVHFYAIIRGRQHRFNVIVGSEIGGSQDLQFHAPMQFEQCTVLGAIMKTPMSIEVLHFTTDLIEKHGKRDGGYVALTVTRRGGAYMLADDRIPIITEFSESLVS